jgi:endonuclease G
MKGAAIRRIGTKGAPAFVVFALSLPLAFVASADDGALADPRSPKAAAASAPPPRAPLRALRQSPHLMLGLPVDSTPDDDFLIDHPQFVTSYNPRTRIANWVAWRLRSSDLGAVTRAHKFAPDPSLPARFSPVLPSDYAHSGYDRGHLCPSGDRTASATDNEATFFMTNVHPQLRELNGGPWEELEEFTRMLAREHDVYIVAGPLLDPSPETTPSGIAIPMASWKVIVPLPKGATAASVTADVVPLAVVLPNAPGVGDHAWTDHLTTVDGVEDLTGYDLLSDVTSEVQNAIEAKTALGRTDLLPRTPGPRRHSSAPRGRERTPAPSMPAL